MILCMGYCLNPAHDFVISFTAENRLQYVAQFPATKDVNLYFVPQKVFNQLKLILTVASVFKKQVLS